jgi:hypothetical protein
MLRVDRRPSYEPPVEECGWEPRHLGKEAERRSLIDCRAAFIEHADARLDHDAHAAFAGYIRIARIDP